MKRIRRWAFSGISAASLALCATCLAYWISCCWLDEDYYLLAIGHGPGIEFIDGNGMFYVGIWSSCDQPFISRHISK